MRLTKWINGRIHKQNDEQAFDLWEISVIKKLAAYEDAEEQGLLVKLPCKVGDTVYSLERFCDGNIGDCDSWLKCEECKDYQQEVIEHRIGTLSQAVSIIEMLGKTVFLTREKAEAALKGEREDV